MATGQDSTIRNRWIDIFFILLVASLSIAGVILGPSTTGFSVLELSSVPKEGPQLTGLVRFNLSSEILIPFSTLLVVSTQKQVSSYTLTELFGPNVPSGKGNFHYPGSSFDSQGFGYGVKGLDKDTATLGFGRGYPSKEEVVIQINLSIFNLTMPEDDRIVVSLVFEDETIDTFTYEVAPELRYADADGDGFLELVDCDDDNPQIHPNMTEIYYNGIDDDCNPSTVDNDKDNDGYPHPEDCDDSSDFVNPGELEIANDAFDNDCNPDTPDKANITSKGMFMPKDNVSILAMTTNIVGADQYLQLVILTKLGTKPLPRPDNVVLVIKDASKTPTVFSLADSMRFNEGLVTMEGSFNGTGFYFLNWTVHYRGNQYDRVELVFVNDWDSRVKGMDEEIRALVADTQSYFDHLIAVIEHQDLLQSKDMKQLSDSMLRVSSLLENLADDNVTLMSARMELIHEKTLLRSTLSEEVLTLNLETPYLVTEHQANVSVIPIAVLVVVLLAGLFALNKIYMKKD